MAQYISNTTSHIISLLLTLTSTIFLFLLILYNIPLPPNPTPTSIDASSRFWLIRVSQAGVEYGFGVWGWCEWASGTGARDVISSVAQDARGICTTQAFWRIPNTAEPEDPVRRITLPDQISSSLSTASFFLVFALILSFFNLIQLLWSLIYPPEISFKLSQHAACKYPTYRTCTTYYGSCAAWTQRDLTSGIIQIFIFLGLTLPSLIIVGQSKDTVNGYGTNGESSNYGIGWGFLIAVVAMEIISIMMLWIYGHRVAGYGGVPDIQAGAAHTKAVEAAHKRRRGR